MSYFGYFFRIVIPLSSAIIAVIGLYCFVGHWNDFMTALSTSRIPTSGLCRTCFSRS